MKTGWRETRMSSAFKVCYLRRWFLLVEACVFVVYFFNFHLFYRCLFWFYSRTSLLRSFIIIFHRAWQMSANANDIRIFLRLVFILAFKTDSRSFSRSFIFHSIRLSEILKPTPMTCLYIGIKTDSRFFVHCTRFNILNEFISTNTEHSSNI